MPGQRAIGPTQRHLFLNNMISKKYYVLKTYVYTLHNICYAIYTLEGTSGLARSSLS